MTDRSQIKLYSGGHRGTESEFGKLAEEWGIEEVTFTFEGHKSHRDRGLKFLSSEELDHGDVSMEIVSIRMARTYTRANKIRNVIQSIFHMVNNGYHVVAVGWIQPDGTVKGGTGWGVELAKLFNRPLHVFDQDRNEWFAWKGNQWEEERPVIKDRSFSGTGTRNLTEAGARALREMFTASFGPANLA